MKSVMERKLVWVAIACFLVFVLSPSFGVAETKTTVCKKCVRAVYKGGLDLNEEPAGTILADSSVCLSKNPGAERYDYKGRLADNVLKANTRMTAKILDKKIAGYTGSIELLDRNIALISGTVTNFKHLDGITGYLLPIGVLQATLYQGAKFEGKCYRAPDTQQFGQPDALGELNVEFDKGIMFAETSPAIEDALAKELPQKLTEFAALEKEQPASKKAKEDKEKKFAALTDEVMAKVGDFIAIDHNVAATLMPREFGGRGTRVGRTPGITLAATPEKCQYDILGGLTSLDAKVYDITVYAVSVSHTFRKCMPEKQALAMLKDQFEAKKKLLQKERAKYVKALSDTGKERAALEKSKPQYFGD